LRLGKISSIYLSKENLAFFCLPGQKIPRAVSVALGRLQALLSPAIERVKREFRTELPFLAAISPASYAGATFSAVLSAALGVDPTLYPPDISRRTLITRLENLTSVDSVALMVILEKMNAKPEEEEKGVFDKALEATGRKL